MSEADGGSTDPLDDARRRAAAVRDEQVDRALTRLEATGEVTPERRRAVERLADRLVERILPPAAGGARRVGGENGDGASAEPDPERVGALFDG